MGTYLNPGKQSYQMAVNSAIFVDKSEMIQYLNTVINTQQRYVSVSRPRRFGKTMAAAIGVRDNTISRWELGGNMPKDQYSMQLAAFFKVSVLYLMGASDDRNVILTEEEEEQIDEERLLTLYRLLSPKMQKMLIYTAHSAYLADRERQ